MTNIKLDIQPAIHGSRATVVKLWVQVNGELIEVCGEALRHPDDKNNEQVATLLANGRALETMGKKLQKRARGLVKHNDDLAALKVHQKKAKANRKRKSQAV